MREWKEKFFLQDQTNTMDHEQVFILVSFWCCGHIPK